MKVYVIQLLLFLCLLGAAKLTIQAPASRTPLEHTETITTISPRVTYDASSSTIRVKNATTPELGYNPSLTESEVKAILALNQVEALECYFCPVGCRELKQIMTKHNLRRLVLGYGRDETCAVLRQFKSLESIDFRDGDVTHSGLIFLSRLPKLNKLQVATSRLELVNLEAAMKRFSDIDFAVYELL